MRHAMRGRKLGRTSAHREALFRNQLQSLVVSERIVTTLPKAKELRPIAEKVITRGKHGTVHDRRWALRWLLDRELVKKLFDDIAPRFKERNGGYTRIIKIGIRHGDAAPLSVIELVTRQADIDAAADDKKKKRRGAPRAGKPAAKGGKAEEAPAQAPRKKRAAAG
jgi:large subunit ribosomal protein L17